jgi:hypothetical protein
LKGIYDIRKELLPEGKMTLAKEPKSVRLGYYPDKNRRAAEIEVGRMYKNRYVKLSLYPTKFHGQEFAAFKSLLKELLPPFDYQEFFFHSKVSHIELACDSLTHPAHSFIPFRAKSNCSRIYVDNTGALGTTYLGSQSSNLRFTIYDKAKQLTELGKEVPYKVHTRIEYKQYSLKISPAELSKELPNPFQKLRVADLKLAKEISSHPDWHDFLDACMAVGSAAALGCLTKFVRKKFMGRLLSVQASWWHPQQRWSALSGALTAIAP